MVGQAKLKVYLLGGVRIEFDGNDLPQVRGRSLELLVWLALHPGPRDRDEVAEAIWPNLSASQARNNLRQTLMKLVDAFGEEVEPVFIRGERDVVGLQAADTWTDVLAVQELIGDGRLHSAEGLLKGELAPPLSVGWLSDFRAEMRRHEIELLERLAQRAELDSDGEKAARLTERWVALESGAERPRRELIKRRLQAGEQVAAGEAAHDLLELLADQEVAPSPETQAVLDRLHLKGDDPSRELEMTDRETLLIQLGSHDDIRALAAAQALAGQLLRCSRGGYLTCEVGASFAEDEPLITVKWAGVGQEVSVPLDKARGLLANEDDFLAHVLISAFLPEDADAHRKSPAGGVRRTTEAQERVVRDSASSIRTERSMQIVEDMRNEIDVALIGLSAAGKSITAMQAVGALSEQGWTSTWIDLSEPAASELTLLFSLLLTEPGSAGKHIFVIDDLQANPGLATKLSTLLARLMPALECVSMLLLVGWDSARSLVGELWPKAKVMACAGEQILPAIADGLSKGSVSPEALTGIRDVSQGDLLVARKALERHAEKGSVPTLAEIAGTSFESLTQGRPLSPEATKLAYLLAALGQFEIDASRDFAQAATKPGFDELLERRVVRPYGEFVAVGHRSHAALISIHLAHTNPEIVQSQEAPAKVAVNYLRTAGDSQIIATLERLDLAGSSRDDSDQHGSEFLRRAWESIKILSNYLRRHTEADPTWGDNVASAVNAANALARFDAEAWAKIARFIRGRWHCEAGGDLPAPSAEVTSERDDFDAISGRMEEEDKLKAEAGEEVEVAADGIDFDRVHRTWVLGQLLGFEAAAPRRDRARIACLLEAARRQMEPEGNFYPARVPWVTARVVLGLAAAGDTFQSSDVVRQACDWLRRPSPEGPYDLGVWEGGTGTWNSAIETTSMCLSALVRAGVPLDDPAIRSGRSFLLSNRHLWVKAGAEVDAATALEAFILTGGRWREVRPELMRLLAWAQSKEPWTRTSLSALESQEQSSAVAQIANALVGILWATVKSELPLLFEGLAVRELAGAARDPEMVASDG